MLALCSVCICVYTDGRGGHVTGDRWHGGSQAADETKVTA